MDSFDFLVIGGGIAGLSAVIKLAQQGSVLCLTKETFGESNTAYAQGGIAVALGGETDVALHLEDTIAAGDGLVDRAAARMLVERGPQRVQELLDWGTEFDRGAGGALLRTREGAHSLSRILHANGDATGREIARALLAHATRLAATGTGVVLREWTTTVDLTIEGVGGEARITGATVLDRHGRLSSVRAGAVLIASGGAGQVYSDTTNPAVATGDGIAMGYRAGAALEDMEFYQFHPTAFALDGAPRFLLSEALRGEGARLVNAKGERFMPSLHSLGELAPRDVVARAITREGLQGPVYLDMRHVTDVDLSARFPGISHFLQGYGFDLQADLIPVRPAAHYLMGGIKTDVHGRSTLKGLYAAGEAACTGVHGANRLASNSLLEGLVFGAEAAQAMSADGLPVYPGELRDEALVGTSPGDTSGDESTERWIAQLRALMWRDAGLLRDAKGLQHAQAALAEMSDGAPHTLTRRDVEARNLRTLAQVMVQAALGREESRGAHYRNDFPARDPAARHSVVEKGRLWFEEERREK